MSTTKIDLGDVAWNTITFVDQQTVDPIDPTAWQVRVSPPPKGELPEETVVWIEPGPVSGTYVELVDGPSVGVYYINLFTDRNESAHVGQWTLWVTSTGTGQASKAIYIDVACAPLEVPAP